MGQPEEVAARSNLAMPAFQSGLQRTTFRTMMSGAPAGPHSNEPWSLIQLRLLRIEVFNGV
jgi:hypothetical protein